MEETFKFKSGDVVLFDGKYGKTKVAILDVKPMYHGRYAKYSVKFLSSKKGQIFTYNSTAFDSKAEIDTPAGPIAALLYGQ